MHRGELRWRGRRWPVPSSSGRSSWPCTPSWRPSARSPHSPLNNRKIPGVLGIPGRGISCEKGHVPNSKGVSACGCRAQPFPVLKLYRWAPQTMGRAVPQKYHKILPEGLVPSFPGRLVLNTNLSQFLFASKVGQVVRVILIISTSLIPFVWVLLECWRRSSRCS